MSHPGVQTAEMVRESWFWASVLRDHATFIHDGLAPHERKWAEAAALFQRRMATLTEEAQALAHSMGLEGPAGSYAVDGAPREILLTRFRGPEFQQYRQAAEGLAERVTDSLQSMKGFKEELIQRKLDCAISLQVPPTLLQHMVNEAEEGYRALSGVREAANLPPSLEALHHHLLWLPDAAGHAAFLRSGADGIEKQLIEQTGQFAEIFSGMQLKAMELYAMLRIAPRMVGALRRLNRDSMAEIATFRAFLAELREHLEGCEVLGNLTPLFADHMLREELYYTEKIMAVPEE